MQVSAPEGGIFAPSFTNLQDCADIIGQNHPFFTGFPLLLHNEKKRPGCCSQTTGREREGFPALESYTSTPFLIMVWSFLNQQNQCPSAPHLEVGITTCPLCPTARIRTYTARAFQQDLSSSADAQVSIFLPLSVPHEMSIC